MKTYQKMLFPLVAISVLSGCGGGDSGSSSTVTQQNSNQPSVKSIYENTQLYYTFDMNSNIGKTYKSTINLSIKSDGGISGEWNSPYGNFTLLGSAGNHDPNVYLKCLQQRSITSQCLGASILNSNPGVLFISASNSQKTQNCSLVESIKKIVMVRLKLNLFIILV